MSLQNSLHLWRPDLAAVALDTSRPVQPLHFDGWWEVEPYEVQSRGIAWLYAAPRSVLGDVTGLGKTIHIIGTIVALAVTGELAGRKALVVVEPGAVEQIAGEFATKAPKLRVRHVTPKMDRQRRRTLYSRDADVIIMGYPTMWRDAALLTQQRLAILWFDESTAFANDETKTAQGARTIAANVPRIHCATATPVMMGLLDLYSPLRVLGLAGITGTVFGNLYEYQQRYLIARHQSVRRAGMGGAETTKTTWAANPATLPEFRAKLAPYYLRRNEGTADMPEVYPPEDIWLDMTPAQLQRYRSIQNGAEAVDSRFLRLLQAATTLANLGDEDHSAKFDWFMHALDTRYVDDDGNPEKVVVYLANRAAVEALRRRLAAVGWGAALITGDHRNERETERQRFWNDPNCRVAIGTRAIEKSLNLQVARWAVMLDLLFNPSRIEQFLGRVKRTNSRFSHVHLDRVMCRGTAEEGLLRVVRDRQALADYVHQDVSDIFKTLTVMDPAAAQAVLNYGSAA